MSGVLRRPAPRRAGASAVTPGRASAVPPKASSVRALSPSGGHRPRAGRHAVPRPRPARRTARGRRARSGAPRPRSAAAWSGGPGARTTARRPPGRLRAALTRRRRSSRRARWASYAVARSARERRGVRGGRPAAQHAVDVDGGVLAGQRLLEGVDARLSAVPSSCGCDAGCRPAVAASTRARSPLSGSLRPRGEPGDRALLARRPVSAPSSGRGRRARRWVVVVRRGPGQLPTCAAGGLEDSVSRAGLLGGAGRAAQARRSGGELGASGQQDPLVVVGRGSRGRGGGGARIQIAHRPGRPRRCTETSTGPPHRGTARDGRAGHARDPIAGLRRPALPGEGRPRTRYRGPTTAQEVAS